jgi:acetyl-CoA carboxylase carboxyl transferase subunit beta
LTEILDIAKKDGRWTECPACKEISITEKLKENLSICPHCDFHFRVGPRDRMTITCGKDGFSEIDLSLSGKNVPAGEEGFKCYNAAIKGEPCIIGVMDFSFMGGTMGTALGQSVMSMLDYSSAERTPAIIFCASGGVRVQEGIWGLMQMIRTVYRKNISTAPLITVYTDPCYGGVTASFSSQADFIIAEQGARIGFAGPRVIETTTHAELPGDFQTASRTLSNGFVDAVVHRREIPQTLYYILKWL